MEWIYISHITRELFKYLCTQSIKSSKEFNFLLSNLFYCHFLHFLFLTIMISIFILWFFFNVERLFLVLIMWQANGFCKKDRYKMSTIDKYCTYSKRMSHQSSDVHLLISHPKYERLFLLVNQVICEFNWQHTRFALLCILCTEANVSCYSCKMCVYITNKAHVTPGRVNITGTISTHWNSFLQRKYKLTQSFSRQIVGACSVPSTNVRTGMANRRKQSLLVFQLILLIV